jgi:hypothetical protein
MSTECLSTPIEVHGTVTALRVRGKSHEMTLRYDFDPGAQRGPLDEALAALRTQTRRPRRTTRVPLKLATDAAPLARDLQVTVMDVSRAGAQLRVAGAELPPIEAGSRLVMRHAGRGPGMQRPLRLILEVRWVGPRRRSGGRRTQVVGGRFVEPSDAVRKRLRALLRFEETRPLVTLKALLAPRPEASPAPASKRRKAQHKR